jgi:hypothetical protein
VLLEYSRDYAIKVLTVVPNSVVRSLLMILCLHYSSLLLSGVHIRRQLSKGARDAFLVSV